MHLSRVLPVEGGLYEWARIAFNDQIGFFVAWNLWLYVILYVGLGGLVTVSFASYVIPGAAWIASSKWLIVGASFAVIATQWHRGPRASASASGSTMSAQ